MNNKVKIAIAGILVFFMSTSAYARKDNSFSLSDGISLGTSRTNFF